MQPGDVKNLLDQFTQMRKMMKQFAASARRSRTPRTAEAKTTRRASRRAGVAKAGASRRRGRPPYLKSPLTLPGLEGGEGLPPGFPSLPDT